MGITDQFRLSYQMTVSAAKMTAKYPASLLVAFANLVFLTFVAVGPISVNIYLIDKDPETAYWMLKYIFQWWIVDNTYQATGFNDIGALVGAFTLWMLVIFFIWTTIVTFSSLVTATVIMHTGMMQLKGQKPSLAEGFRLVGQNIWRLAGLAIIAGFLLTLAKRFGSVLRAIPILGRFMRKAILVALNGVLYVTLPIVVYERAGPWSAFRNSWTNVRKTWGGLVVGTGLMVSGIWMGMWFVWYAVQYAFEQMVGVSVVNWSTILILQLIGAVLLYCVNIALSANLRAALYLHVTEGHTGIIPARAFANNTADVPTPRGDNDAFRLSPPPS